MCYNELKCFNQTKLEHYWAVNNLHLSCAHCLRLEYARIKAIGV
jgi:hypothetical protein